MTISLIVGTYNRSVKISDTLQSVLAQKRQADEVIVVDDGSTDDTAEFVRKHFPMVQVLTKNNGGTSSARNFGASNAKGDWLVFLDHDDLLLPNALSELERLSELWPQADALYCDHELHDCTNNTIHKNHHGTFPSFQRLFEIPRVDQRDQTRLYGRELFTTLLKGNLLQQPWMIRAAVFQELTGFDEDIRYCEDWDMYLRVTRGHRVAMSDAVISIHRIEGQNLHLEDWVKQYDMYEKTLVKQFKASGPLSLTENMTIRRKMAEIQKRRGDRFYALAEFGRAWNHYLYSASWLPTDFVVVARLGLWLPKLVLRHASTP
jgi:glycosyltransferase involved in cell wall biosynthesis